MNRSQDQQSGGESIEEIRKKVRGLFLDFHPDRAGDDVFHGTIARMLACILDKIDKDRGSRSVRWNRWQKSDEALVSPGLTFAEGNASITYYPPSPVALVQTLERVRKGVIPAANAPDQVRYDVASEDERSTGRESKEFHDVVFQEATLREIYNIDFIVQRHLYDNEEFVTNSLGALQGLNAYLQSLPPEKQRALAGITINLVGYVSNIKMALAESRFRRSLIERGAAWESTSKFCINPAILNEERTTLGTEGTKSVLEAIFEGGRYVFGYERDIKGNREDIRVISQWLQKQYGIQGLTIPTSWDPNTESDESRLKAFVALSRLARHIRDAQMEFVERDGKRVREQVYSDEQVRNILDGSRIVITDKTARRTTFHAQAENGVLTLYINEAFGDLAWSNGVQELLRERFA